MLTKQITATKTSQFGDNYEQIQFPNGKWYDVEKGSYFMVKFHNKGKWFLINKDSELNKL